MRGWEIENIVRHLIDEQPEHTTILLEVCKRLTMEEVDKHLRDKQWHEEQATVYEARVEKMEKELGE